MKVIIVENEVNALSSLKKLLNYIDDRIEIVGETGFITKAKELIQIHKPELVFLDIELQDGTAFDFIKSLATINFKIIFTTAYSQYAIKAFKYSAVDYLLKPIDPIELEGAILRTRDEIKKDLKQQELLNIFSSGLSDDFKKIVLKTSEKTHILKLDDIIRLEADTSYTIVITKNEKIVVSKHLKYYEELLDESFIRCHQSHIINLKHIKGIVKGKLIELLNGELIPVSVRKKAEISQVIIKRFNSK